MPDPLEVLRTALGERYDVERAVGQGGMATVYRAQDHRHERAVAIKVLRPELAASLGGDRFLREIRLAAQLQHPNILALYDSGVADGLLYYVMPFVEGESLRHRLTREQQLALPDAIQITCEVADALEYAHKRGVIHRDIKPENILLVDGHAVVADFGIARAVSQAAGEKLTEKGMAVGTPHYMSPEQGVGSEHVDARSDLYSLACVLYELIIGQPPFDGPNAMAILARHSMEGVPSLQVVRHAVPDEIEDAIMRALEKVPADRFGSMREFAEALAVADLGPGARRSSARMATLRRNTPRGVSARRSTPGGLAARGGDGLARLRRMWPVAVGLGGLLLVAAGLGARRVWPGAAAASASDLDPRHLAVLYFEPRGGNDSLGFVADGLTEALIHELSQVRPLQVTSRNGVSRFRHAALAPDSIGRALKVGTLVEGTLAQAGDRLRLSVSLISTATGAEVASKVLERPRTEIFALQDDLAKEIALFLRERLGGEVQLLTGRKGTQNVAAWELLQRAQAGFRDLDPLIAAGDTTAIGRHIGQLDSLLATAAALDPNWGTPVVQRGWLAYRRSRVAGSLDKEYYSRWIGTSMTFAERALALQPGDADALELRGTLRYWRWLLNLAPTSAEASALVQSAEEDLRAATAANALQASAWNSLSHLLLATSQTAEAKLAALRAYEADPYLTDANKTVWRLFQSSLDLEDRAEATRWCVEGQRRFGGDPRFVECRLWLNALAGERPDIPRTWSLAAEYERLSPANQRAFQHRKGELLVALALARAGLADSARNVALRSRPDAAMDPTRDLAFVEAIVRAILDDRDEALRLLGTYLASNPQQRAAMAHDESWWFRTLKTDPRYKQLVGA